MGLNNLRIVFMGTPEFAVASLQGLIAAGCNVVGVVTAPDKPAGRGQKIHETDVKRFALTHPTIPILQPEKLKDPIFIENLHTLHADLFVVVAFRMLPEIVWSMPAKGTINLHASLLPQYRGAAPINWAIIQGENLTGVTTFFIEKEIDTGKVILTETVSITETDNAGSLHDKLMNVGAGLLVKTVTAIASGTFIPKDQLGKIQPEDLKTAPKIFKETCVIAWNSTVKVVYDFIRGLSPYPTACTTLVHGETKQHLTVKIYETEMEVATHPHSPGTLFTDDKKFVKVAVSDGYLHLKSLQLEGKKRLGIEEFLRGFKNCTAYRLE